jgi:hypothetical protein
MAKKSKIKVKEIKSKIKIIEEKSVSNLEREIKEESNEFSEQESRPTSRRSFTTQEADNQIEQQETVREFSAPAEEPRRQSRVVYSGAREQEQNSFQDEEERIQRYAPNANRSVISSGSAAPLMQQSPLEPRRQRQQGFTQQEPQLRTEDTKKYDLQGEGQIGSRRRRRDMF